MANNEVNDLRLGMWHVYCTMLIILVRSQFIASHMDFALYWLDTLAGLVRRIKERK